MTPFEVEVPAGEKSYTLCFNIGAIVAIEKRLDKSFNAIAAEMQDPMTMRITTLRELMFAGLRLHHPALSIDDAGDVIQQCGGIVVAIEKIAAAIVAAFPQPGEVATAARPTNQAASELTGSTH